MKRLLLAAALFCIPHEAQAGAWTQPAGRALLIQSSTYYSTREAFDAAGDRAGVPRFSKYELNPYGEYGWSDDLTLGFSAFLQYLEQETASGGGVLHNTGLGETELFVRTKLYDRNGMALSLQPLVTLPSRYRHDAPVAGRANWDGELALLGGYGFDALGRHHYFDAKAGYRYRSGVPEDQWRASAALGIGVSADCTLLAETEWHGRTRGSAASAFSVSGQNDYRLRKAQFSAVYRIDERYAVQFGGFRHLAGENTGAGGGAFFALRMGW